MTTGKITKITPRKTGSGKPYSFVHFDGAKDGLFCWDIGEAREGETREYIKEDKDGFKSITLGQVVATATASPEEQTVESTQTSNKDVAGYATSNVLQHVLPLMIEVNKNPEAYPEAVVNILNMERMLPSWIDSIIASYNGNTDLLREMLEAVPAIESKDELF